MISNPPHHSFGNFETFQPPPSALIGSTVASTEGDSYDPHTDPMQVGPGWILETADDLFYREGIRAVGIDTIVEKSGVAKMSLYGISPQRAIWSPCTWRPRLLVSAAD
jgi:hypothetical protein